MPVFLTNILVLILITLLVLILANPIIAKKDKLFRMKKNAIKNKKIDLKKIDIIRILLGILISILLCPLYYICLAFVLSIIFYPILDIIYGSGSISWVYGMIIGAIAAPILAIITAIKIKY